MTGLVKVDEIQNRTGTTTLAKLENGSLTGVLSPQTGFRNRIINGDMRIDQRNNGASVSGFFNYAVDRFNVGQSGGETAVFTQQRDTSAPAGFNNSLKLTVTTAQTSFTASQRVDVRQRVEGFNVADLNFGTANASTVTLSFWVRSSLTGTFGGSILNGAGNRSYPYAYTINAANTWEYKTVTIPGDTTGTWATDNSNGMAVTWCLGGGSSLLGTAGAWTTGAVFGATGQVNLVATNGATWYVTGVQLEKGTVATPFEFRSIGQELALCQRYFEKGLATNYGVCTNGQGFGVPVVFKIEMRAAPTVVSTAVSTNIGSSGANSVNISSFSYVYFLSASATGTGNVQISYTASAEL